jgi:tRNA 2-thiouridine synthesizing protein A
MDLKDETVARSIDVKGQVCPYPIIATRVELKKMGVGEVLEVTTDNPPTANETMPALCQSKNYPFEREELTPGVWKFRIRKASP